MQISEIFYSIQGEGPTVGKPAVFIRLGMCNLHCGGISRDGTKWHCDTYDVWNKHTSKSIDEVVATVLALVPHFGQFDVSNVSAVITGGEPMLQQPDVTELCYRLSEKGFYIEIETNATLKPTDELYNLVDHFNVSPKLPNSGNREPAPHSVEAMQMYARHKGHFKFVITDEDDYEDILTYYGGFFDDVDCWHRVYLMPACESAEQFVNTAPTVAEIAKAQKLNFSTRLQINIWDKATGV